MKIDGWQFIWIIYKCHLFGLSAIINTFHQCQWKNVNESAASFFPCSCPLRFAQWISISGVSYKIWFLAWHVCVCVSGNISHLKSMFSFEWNWMGGKHTDKKALWKYNEKYSCVRSAIACRKWKIHHVYSLKCNMLQ